jgi:hypothetical protein
LTQIKLNAVSKKICYAASKDELVFTDYNNELGTKQNDSIRLYFYNLKHRKLSNECIVPADNSDRKNLMFGISNIAYSDTHLAILYYNTILLLKKTNHGVEILNTIRSDVNPYRFVSFISDRELFMGKYIFREKKSDHYLATFNLKKKKIQYKHEFDFELMPFFNYQPNHYVDAIENIILQAETMNYRITFFNEKLRQLSEINRGKNDWKKSNMDFQSLLTEKPENILDILMDIDTNCSRIEGCWFINTKTVAVKISQPNSLIDGKYRNAVYYDVWTFDGTNWLLQYEYLYDFTNDSPDVIIDHNTPLIQTDYYPCILFTDEFLIVFKNASNINPYGKSYSAYKNEEQEYYFKNEPVLSIHIYRHNFR